MKNQTLERYVETVAELQNGERRARTKKIAEKLEVKEPSVTEMLQKLQKKDYIDYRPYQGAALTKKGKKLADELEEKHVTLAEFLEMLGVDGEIADKDACKIEHIVDSKTVENIKKFLEFVDGAPEEPKWLEHYKEFAKTGKYTTCKRREERE